MKSFAENSKKSKAYLNIAVIILTVISSIALFQNVAFGVPPVVQLGAVLTEVSDGTTPFPSIDPNGNNDIVATLDTTSYTFDVNMNTLDAASHTLSNVTIVATLTSSSADINWLLNTLPTACGTKNVSVDGKTLTCVLSGTFATGTTLNISAGWFAQSGVANATNVTAQFSVSATMVADATGADNPTTATSNSNTVQVVSQDSDYEVRKQPGPITILRDGAGLPTDLQVDWGMQVEVKNPNVGQLKGVSTTSLGDLSLDDALASGDPSQLPVNQEGVLVGCSPVATSNPYISNSSSATFGDTNSVQSSGSWNCSQAGGTGTDISVSATSLNWSPDWFTMGKVSNRLHYWAYNSGSTNETYNSPSGENDQAVVATQIVSIKYPYSTVIAFDQTAGDRDVRSNFISWCNDLDNINVVGGNTGVDDSSNNQNCVTFYNATGAGPSKQFTKYGSASPGPETELGLVQGALGQTSTDNYVAPGQKFGQTQQMQASASNIYALSDLVMCDAIDTSTYNLIQNAAPSVPSGGTGSSHDWYSWYETGTADAAFSDITDSDVTVDFSSTGSSWANTSEQRTVNCDDPSLTWVSDPSTHPDGLNNVNLIRVRLGVDLPPGKTINFFQSVQAKTGLDVDTRLYNFSQYKTSTLNSGDWVQAGSNCKPEIDPWNPSSGTYSCKALVDRAFVILPSAIMQKYDVTPNGDTTSTVSLGSTRTFNLKAGMAAIADTDVNGVKVYDVMPPGMDYQSSTITPDGVINDCDATTNFDCISNASARTDIGYTTVFWERGDFNFVHSGADGTPSQDYDLFGLWQITVKISSYIPNSALLQNKAWIDADSGLQPLPDPIPFRSTNTVHSDPTSGPFDDDWVQIATAQSFNIEKYITSEEIPLNGTLSFNLAYGNLTGIAKVMDAIDIFPFVGDGRSPNSVIDGGFTLDNVYQGFSNDGSNQIANIYVTSDDPSTLSSDPNDASNPAVGSGKWACTYSQIGTYGCPNADEVTAIRIKTTSLTAGQYGIIRVDLGTFGNDGEETYTNNYQARATSLALPVTSSDVHAVTPQCLNIGNLVFKDVNQNGKYDSGDIGFGDVLINLYSVGVDGDIGGGDDILYKTTTSDSDGSWYISCVAPDSYYVELDPSNFDVGGPLHNYTAAPDGSTDPTDNQDQENEQDLIKSGSAFRTNIFDVDYGISPTGETGTTSGLDALENLTIDLGLIVDPSSVPTTTTTTTVIPAPGGSNVANSNLARTGQNIDIYTPLTLILAGLSICILCLITRRKRKMLLKGY
ncbi:MAG: SdrD B-like domain-containing protein [Acidimicrobiia bacterium]